MPLESICIKHEYKSHESLLFYKVSQKCLPIGLVVIIVAAAANELLNPMEQPTSSIFSSKRRWLPEYENKQTL